ncbi:MAG TPA: hypothetical protein VE155_07210 [Pseudonocardiaceae bacterium]|nr:hypothetical protein [Pseudonocardiaceae bacterium]
MTALLVFDVETTGLTTEDTILEAAWTVCDLDGSQRLPLRSRFCQIAAPGYAVLPDKRSEIGHPVWFDSRCPGDETALRMAEESGLFDAWLACPPERRLTSGGQLSRLLLDDIVEVCAPDEKVHVAGCGVAQFDAPLLRLHCPTVVSPQGMIGLTHYRCVDQSVTQTALLGNNAEYEIIRWFLREYGVDRTRIVLAMRPQYAYGDDVPSAWLSGERGQHRAAPDVAKAIVIQRALWEYGSPLRQALADIRTAQKVGTASGH